MKYLVSVFLAGLLLVPTVQGQKFDQLAQTPPMGWNSWNTFSCDIDAELIKETADAMVESGMKAAGYEYVNIDDCWHGERDSLGFIQAHPERFPNGMKAVADYVHSKGLKIGIYSDAGSQTCAGRPGSQGHEYQDAMTYAKWGIDYLKYDWCNTGERNPREAYRTMRDALYAAGRPIVLSICEWGDHQPWEWAEDVGHLWRTTGDITNCWDCTITHGLWQSHGIMPILDMQEGLRSYAGPGHWNDPDMMEVGNLDSVTESRAHFSMWAMLAAPLIAGNDIRNMTEETREILTNEEVIAVDQDTLGIQGFPYKTTGGMEYWFKPLAGGEWAVAVLNRNDEGRDVRFEWSGEPVSDALSGRSVETDQVTYRVRDLWAHENIGTTASPLTGTVGAHDVLMVRLVPQSEGQAD